MYICKLELNPSLKNRSASNLLITQLLPTLRIKELINIHAEFGKLFDMITILKLIHSFLKIHDILKIYINYLQFCDFT